MKGRPKVHPEDLTTDQIRKKMNRARQRALSELADKHPVEYKILVDKHREDLGLAPLQTQSRMGRVSAVPRTNIPQGERYFVFARSQVEAYTWCKEQGLNPHGKQIIYIGDGTKLRGMELNLEHGHDVLVMLPGWRMTKTSRVQDQIEQLLMVAAIRHHGVLSWADIITKAYVVERKRNGKR